MSLIRFVAPKVAGSTPVSMSFSILANLGYAACIRDF
jgi:hypothetical protein